MQALELKVPPPLVALIAAIAMWAIARASGPADPSFPLREVMAVALALCGFAIGTAGVHAFRRAQTTIHPMRPQEASAMVTSGIYRFTRNPMYLGVVLVLLGWNVHLLSAWALIGPAAFVLYIGRFQIAPEERVLSEKFGTEFDDYKARVRRWV